MNGKGTAYIRYIGRGLLALGLVLVLAGCNWATPEGSYDTTIMIQTPETSQLYPADGSRRSLTSGSPLRPAITSPAGPAASVSTGSSVTAAEEVVEEYGFDWFDIIVIREDLLEILIEAEQEDLTDEEFDELVDDILNLEEQFSESALESFFEALFYGDPATLRANFGGQGGGMIIQVHQDYQAGDTVPFTFRNLEGDARYVILSTFERDTEDGFFEVFGIDRVTVRPGAVTDASLQLNQTCADFEGQMVEWFGASLDWCFDDFDDEPEETDPLEGSITLTDLDEVEDLFATITFENIRDFYSEQATDLNINNSDDSLIPDRTVLTYETSEGLFGKMLIVQNNAGDGILLEHITFDAEGEPYNDSIGEPVEVPGTWGLSLETGDLETGVEDFRLQNLTGTERLFSPQNGARFYANGIDIPGT